MDAAETDEANSVEPIAPDGDIVLVVGEQKARLKVYSQCLRSASKVFDSMFSARWTNGQDVSGQACSDVPLVDDDVYAMRLICSVLHHRNFDIPGALTAKEVLQIAVEADKYDFSMALKYARAEWLKPKGNENMVDIGYLMAAAFLFGDNEAFVARSLNLIIHYKETYLDLMNDDKISQILPWRTFCKKQPQIKTKDMLTFVDVLAERRTRIRAEISQLILGWANGGCTCGWGKEHGDKYALLQSEYQPLQIIEVPVMEVIDKMKTIPTKDMARKRHPGGIFSMSYYHEAIPQDQTLLGRLESIERRSSVCLDCVRTSAGTGLCKFEHERATLR